MVSGVSQLNCREHLIIFNMVTTNRKLHAEHSLMIPATTTR